MLKEQNEVLYIIIYRTLRESWDNLKHETEASGRIHLGLAQKILDEIHHTVKEFREQQRDIRKKVHAYYVRTCTYVQELIVSMCACARKK